MNLMKKKDTLIINLIGGPGSGKSTTAAGLFYKLKQMGIDCEKNVYICDVGGEQNHEQARVKKFCLLCRVKWFHVINPSTQESILF